MSSMPSRERVLKAINHEEPDRVPLDLGGSHVSTIHYEAYGKLLEHLHIEQNRPPIRKVAQTVNEICEPLLEHFGIDFLCLMPGMSSSTKNKDLPDGTWQDEFGVVRQRTAKAMTYTSLLWLAKFPWKK